MTFLSADRILKNANLIRQMLGYSSGVSYETSSQKVNIARLERKREELRREREISAGIRGQAEGCGQAHDTISELRLRAAEWAKMKVRSRERNEQLHADLERLIKDVSESHPLPSAIDLVHAQSKFSKQTTRIRQRARQEALGRQQERISQLKAQVIQ